MLDKVIAWRERRLTDRQMTLVLAFIIGFLASVAGYALHHLIGLIQRLLTEDFISYGANWLYLVFPVIGIYLTMLFIKYVVRDNISHGITRVLYAISTRRSKLRGHNCWSSIVASAITIGRSTYCAYRLCNWFEIGPSVPHGQPNVDAFSGLWCICCDFRYLQSANSRLGIYS